MSYRNSVLRLYEQYVLDVVSRDVLVNLFINAKEMVIGPETLQEELGKVGIQLLSDAVKVSNLRLSVVVSSDVEVFVTQITSPKSVFTIYVPYGSVVKYLDPKESAAAFLLELGLCYMDIKYGIYGTLKLLDIALKGGLFTPVIGTIVKIAQILKSKKKIQLSSRLFDKILFAILAACFLFNLILYMYNIRSEQFFRKDKALYFLVRMGLVSHYYSYYLKFREKFHSIIIQPGRIVDTLANVLFKLFGKMFVPMYTGYPVLKIEQVLGSFVDYVNKKQIETNSKLTEKEKNIILSQITYLKKMVKEQDDTQQIFDTIVKRLSQEILKRTTKETTEH